MFFPRGTSRGAHGAKFMKVKLSDHFRYGTLLKFVFPSICMMVFTSIYGVVDGLFVSNFAGKTPFAAINLIMPFLMIMGAVGFMLGAGGARLFRARSARATTKKPARIFRFLRRLRFFRALRLPSWANLRCPGVARL